MRQESGAPRVKGTQRAQVDGTSVRRAGPCAWAGLIAGLLVVVPAGLVCAQQAAGAPSARSEDRTGEAKGLFDAGRASFDAGRYSDALDYFERSYAISGRAALLYNIGLAADRARDDDRALTSYESYLAALPDAENRDEVEKRVAALRAAIERRRAASPAPVAMPVVGSAAPEARVAITEPEPEPPEPKDASGTSTLQWAALGASGAVFITGGVLTALAISDKSTVENASDGTRLAEIESAHDRVPTLSAIGGVLLGVGAAGVAASVVWIVTGNRGDTSADAVSLRIGPGSVALRGAW